MPAKSVEHQTPNNDTLLNHEDPVVEFAMRTFVELSGRYPASATAAAAALALRMQNPKYPIQDVTRDFVWPLTLLTDVIKNQLLDVAKNSHRRVPWYITIFINEKRMAQVITQVGNLASYLVELPPAELNSILDKNSSLIKQHGKKQRRQVHAEMQTYAMALLNKNQTSEPVILGVRRKNLRTILLNALLR